MLILERLAINEGHSKDHYTRPSPPPVGAIIRSSIPNNLPRPQSFFGRAKELATIRDSLDPANRSWGALIDGPGGMGKTSLAVRAAFECLPGSFDRIIFVSVKERELDDDGLRTLGNLLIPGFLEMLHEIARELGQPDITKSPEDQRIRLLLEALRPANALLILDNLESLPKPERDQLFNFVKKLPPGCKAILTCRRRIGSGSEELILEKLDQDAALATLADLAHRNPLLAKTSEAERIALYTQTGGKPLLLRWVAGQLGRGSCRTFTDALAFLRTCPLDNDPLEFIFGDLVAEFSAEEERVLCALTYFTLPAKVEHLAAVAGLGDELAENALRSLANRSLVVPDQEEKAYVLVPLAAEFLRRKRPEVVAQTGDRLEKRVYTLVGENGFGEHDRFSMLDAAWPTVAAALPRFLAGTNEHLQTLCSALILFLEFTGRWDEWFTLSREGEAMAVAAQDFVNAGWRAYQAGIAYRLRGQAAEVLACADRAATYWHKAQAGERVRAIALQLRGSGYRLAKDYPAAIAVIRENVEITRSLDDKSIDLADALNALAAIEAGLGDLDAAENNLREALHIAQVIGHHQGVAMFTCNLADLLLSRRDWPRAESLAREGISLSEKVGRLELIASCCESLAGALVRQDKAADAIPYAQRAVDIYTRLGAHNLKVALATLRECWG